MTLPAFRIKAAAVGASWNPESRIPDTGTPEYLRCFPANRYGEQQDPFLWSCAARGSVKLSLETGRTSVRREGGGSFPS